MSPDRPAQVVIGLDVGTTGAKAAAFAPGSSWRRVAAREYPLSNPAPGRFEQDPAAVVGGAAAALADCTAALDGAEVLAIAVSAGMHALMGIDHRREPVTPLITWADERAADEVVAIHAAGGAADLHARSGVPVHPMTPLAKLLWFRRHDRTTWERTRWWIGLKDHILHWLTGELVTEVSSAAGSGLLDLAAAQWSAEALDACHLDEDRLPPILATTATLRLSPAVARAVGLPPGTPVVVGAADGPLGNVGTGAFAPGVAGLSLGTSAAVRVVIDRPASDLGGSLFCYPLTEGAWAVGGAVSNGGSALRWAGRTFAPHLVGTSAPGGFDAAVTDLAATVPPGSDGLVMAPHLLPERAPLWDARLAGAYLGLRPDHTAAHLLRATVEGVGMQVRALVDRVAVLHPVDSIRATGGVFRSSLWREVVAAQVGRPLHVVDDADGTALGAAALGLLALGQASDLTGAAAQLGVDCAAPPPPVEVDPVLVDTYDRQRGSVPELLEQLVASVPPEHHG